MAIDIQITAKGLSPKISASEIRTLKKGILRAIAIDWHKRYSQFKFTTAAARKYNYTKRKTKEVRTGTVLLSKRSKRPLAPSGLPLVWIGESRGLAKFKVIRASSKRSSVTSPIGKLNFKPRGAHPSLNMRREYTRVLPSEERQLARDVERIMRSQFSRGKKNIRVIAN